MNELHPDYREKQEYIPDDDLAYLIRDQDWDCDQRNRAWQALRQLEQIRKLLAVYFEPQPESIVKKQVARIMKKVNHGGDLEPLEYSQEEREHDERFHDAHDQLEKLTKWRG